MIELDEWALRVLVAEDETLIRLDLRGLLEANGMTVCGEARDGEEAVRLARDTSPDVIVMDLKMPRLDGVEAARRISAERPVPIVMLTAYAERTLVERAIGAGVFSYLVKPFREHDVVPAVKAAFARHAELLSARRTVGAQRSPIHFHLPGRAGAWPLRVDRAPDGTLRVEARDDANL
jgi:response regulator NasT